MQTQRACCEINLNQYRKNLNKLRQLIGTATKLLLSVKANAYGYGLNEIVNEALKTPIDYFGVATITEAKQIRQHNETIPILLFSDCFKHEMKDIIKYDITLTLNTNDILNRPEIKTNQIKAHIKVDTGMGRLGCDPEKTLTLIKQLKQHPSIIIEGLYTHFSDANNQHKNYTLNQIKLFNTVIQDIKNEGITIPIHHAANSPATINYPNTRYDMVRIGLESYKDILTIKSRVTYLKQVKKNCSISYNRQYTTKRDEIIATISIGYGDGLPMTLSQGGYVLISGKSHPIVGQVCMDYIMVSLGDNSHNIKLGDEVIILGKQQQENIDITKFCKTTKQIPYEIGCRLSRMPMLYTR